LIASGEFKAQSLSFWLKRIATLHPRKIELGLDRVKAVANRMGLTKPARQVITVAGTNGKGSCVACLQAILEQAGYRTGAYTSPHLHHFNERICLEGEEVSDRVLCDAFVAVEHARKEQSLSYFEFGTLAALWLFSKADIDVAILEVGLGGRLDAVNIIDSDIAIITSISLDHQDWLGNDLESIATEKAGIIRHKAPLVYGDLVPCESVLKKADALDAPVYRLNLECYGIVNQDNKAWTFIGCEISGKAQTIEQLPLPHIDLSNAVLAVQAISLLPLAIERKAFEGLALPGRFELRKDLNTKKRVILDVAHNPAAAELLGERLLQFRRVNPGITQIVGVIAVMADKDIESIAGALESCLDICYIAQVDAPRCMPSAESFRRIKQYGIESRLEQFDSLEEAYKAACKLATTEDVVVVTGSFYTVAAVRRLSQ
jgi:dihydrofolate synthase/folylpolyglutamate synthase